MAPEPNQPEGPPGSFGTLPASGPLPPHLVVKVEKGLSRTHLTCCSLTSVLFILWFLFSEADAFINAPPGQTEQGFPPRGGNGGGGGGAEWDRGANLKEYYARRDEQEAQAVLEPAMCHEAAFQEDPGPFELCCHMLQSHDCDNIRRLHNRWDCSALVPVPLMRLSCCRRWNPRR